MPLGSRRRRRRKKAKLGHLELPGNVKSCWAS